MKRVVALLVVVVIAALADCGGSVQPFDVQDDAGNCVHNEGNGYCTIQPGPCDAGPPDGNPNTNDLTNTALVTCSP